MHYELDVSHKPGQEGDGPEGEGKRRGKGGKGEGGRWGVDVRGKSSGPGSDGPRTAVSDIVPVRSGSHGRGEGGVVTDAWATTLVSSSISTVTNPDHDTPLPVPTPTKLRAFD